MTTRMPSRSLSSRISEMPSICFSRTSSAMRSSSVALFTWIRNFGDDDGLAILADLLDLGAGGMMIESRPVSNAPDAARGR
jgi:hypothetical protein